METAPIPEEGRWVRVYDVKDVSGLTHGIGARTRINTSRLVDISSDLPVIVELVYSEEYINRYLLEIEGLLNEGMIILDDVEIIKYSNFEGDH